MDPAAMDIDAALLGMVGRSDTAWKWMTCYDRVFYEKDTAAVLARAEALFLDAGDAASLRKICASFPRFADHFKRLHAGYGHTARYGLDVATRKDALRRMRRVREALPALPVDPLTALMAEVEAELRGTGAVSRWKRCALDRWEASVIVSDSAPRESPIPALPVELVERVVAACSDVAEVAATCKQIRRMCALLKPGRGSRRVELDGGAVAVMRENM
jgi:hypothetical protein